MRLHFSFYRLVSQSSGGSSLGPYYILKVNQPVETRISQHLAIFELNSERCLLWGSDTQRGWTVLERLVSPVSSRTAPCGLGVCSGCSFYYNELWLRSARTQSGINFQKEIMHCIALRTSNTLTLCRTQNPCIRTINSVHSKSVQNYTFCYWIIRSWI